jgi:acyl carrier protein
MSDDPILEQVKAIVTRIAGSTRAPARLDADTPLGEGGLWLDSLDLFEAILACEEGFGVQIEAETDATIRSTLPKGTIRVPSPLSKGRNVLPLQLRSATRVATPCRSTRSAE